MRRIVLAVFVLVGLTVGSFALASSEGQHTLKKSQIATKTVTSFCVYVDYRHIGSSRGDVNVFPIYKNQRCIKGKQGKRGARGAVGARGVAGTAGTQGATGPQGPRGTPGVDGADGTSPHIQRLDDPFAGTNATVATSLDGVQFGPYPDGGAWGGSVAYSGANGLTLADIGTLSYVIEHSTLNDSPISAPYLRIFLADSLDEEGNPVGEHDVIFDPTECATVVPPEDQFNTFNVVGSDVRYDDDSCDGVPPDQQPWDDVVAAHGDEIVTGIYVTAGFAGGAPLAAILRTFSINGVNYTFGV
jgi:hypothetical protein